ncbi:hypothetical protein [Klebsiella variicola]|uniref:hypothetical protein n=1 Tax=Klebsiella variicola TaxID=244366 RepID=UPI0014446065|nr:hypothetical protein [Klebsiella variicola]NKR39335.1 hypothetical protein [Klebsiella variicola]
MNKTKGCLIANFATVPFIKGIIGKNLTNTEAYVNSLKTESYRLGVVFYIIDRQTPT